MKEYIELQTQFCSKIDIKKICTFDYETISEKTVPMYHKSPRFLLVKEGKGKITIDRNEYELRAGGLVSILPWECTRLLEVKEPLCYEIIKYNYDVVADILKSSKSMYDQVSPLKKLEETSYVYLKGDIKQTVENLFHSIREEVGVESVMDFRERKSYQEMNIVMQISSLIISFCRAIDAQKDDVCIESDSYDSRMLILRYIYMHLSEKMTLEKISKQFYLSKNSVRIYIFQKTGLAFHELVNEMRIMKTIHYLLYTDFTLEEVAAILGYVDAAHISKVFSYRMENKISDYRKTYQKVLRIANIEEKKLAYQMVEYINKNFQEEIHAFDTAERFHISIEEMNKHLMIQVEMNFFDYLNKLRIDYTCEMLLNTHRSITDIAFEAGYNTVKTFRRNFIQFRHMLPNEFRMAHARIIN